MENCNFQETYFVSAKNKGFLRNSLFRIVIQFKESKNVVFIFNQGFLDQRKAERN